MRATCGKMNGIAAVRCACSRVFSSRIDAQFISLLLSCSMVTSAGRPPTVATDPLPALRVSASSSRGSRGTSATGLPAERYEELVESLTELHSAVIASRPGDLQVFQSISGRW